MDSPTHQSAENNMTDTAEVNELLQLPELPELESVEEMFMRLLKLVDLLYNATSPVEEGNSEADLVLRAGNAIVPLVRKLRDQYDEQRALITEQETTIGKLKDEVLQKEIELKRTYSGMELQGVQSDSSKQSSEDEEQNGLNNVTLSTWIKDQAVYKESVDNITRDAFQYGQFEPDLGSPNNVAMPTADDSEKVQSRRPNLGAGIGADNQLSPDSSETSQSGRAIQRKSSEESLPQQAYDMTFPSSRGTFMRPGPVYETMPARRTKPMSTQRVSSGEDLTAGGGGATLCSKGSNDVLSEVRNSGGGNKADQKGSGLKLAASRSENDSVYGFSAYIQRLQSTEPQPPGSTPKFLQPRKDGNYIMWDVLEWSLYALLRAGWDLISGQLIAWWHVLLFLITTILHLFTSGTGLLNLFHLPKLPVFIVPRLSWSIIATQVMFFTCLMSFLAWGRELDILLQANGLSRRYMLDYIYEEDRLIFFIGFDKGVFRLGTSEPENFWRSGNNTMQERIIGLTQ